MYVNEKVCVCKTYAKSIIAKLRENVAKLIETDIVDILVSAAFIFCCKVCAKWLQKEGKY